MSEPLALVAYGDPLDRRTWSGTPANLNAALLAYGADVLALNSSSRSRIAKIAVAAAGSATVGSEAWRRSPTSFRLAGQTLARQLGSRRPPWILHLSTHAISYAAKHRLARRNMLFLDATWRLLTAHGRGQGLTAKAWSRINEIEGRAYRDADQIAVTSPHVAADLTEHYGVGYDRITVVGTGTGPITASTKRHYASPELLMIAKVGFAYKGGHLLLEAFDRLRGLRPDLGLTIVAGPDARRIRSRPGLTLHETVTLAELQALYERAWLYVMPAINEPWGLVYLEAMLTETPVVGLRRNALPHITDNGRLGFLIDECSVESLTTAVDRALSDQVSLLDLGRRARGHVAAQFSWDKTAQALCKAMGECEEPHQRS